MRFFSPASSLPGSASIHLPRETEDTYVGLVADVRRNCDMLYTLPGMNSLNLWSGVPTPNGFNLTAWVKGFSAGQQREILYLLQSDTNACVIVNPTRGSEWGTTDADLAASPLAGYILRNMRLASTVHAYEIRINPLRTQPWIQTP